METQDKKVEQTTILSSQDIGEITIIEFCKAGALGIHGKRKERKIPTAELVQKHVIVQWHTEYKEELK